MIGYIILVILIISLFGVGVWVIFNLLRKVELLETRVQNQSEYFVRLDDLVRISNKRLEELDDKGSFSSDDEIGFFFEYVKQFQGILTEYVTKNIKTLEE
tara:strand:+ start:594 stop:893 length:300 start_codon:yes stop_codon:yes gene_type:complete